MSEFDKTRRKKAKDVMIEREFFKIPKVFLKSERYKDMPTMASYLYGVMADRWNLSKSNSGTWVDSEGYIYFVFTNKELASLMGVSVRSVITLKKNLVDYELLQEEATGRANRLYLLSPIYDDDYVNQITKQFTEEPKDLSKLPKDSNGKIISSSDKIPRSANIAHLDETRNANFALLDEMLSNQHLGDFSSPPEVQNLHPNKTLDSLNTDSFKTDTKKEDTEVILANADNLSLSPEMNRLLLDNFVEDELIGGGNILSEKNLITIKTFANGDYAQAKHWRDLITKAKAATERKRGGTLIFENGDIDHAMLDATLRRVFKAVVMGKAKDADGFLWISVMNDFDKMLNDKMQAGGGSYD